MLGSVRGSAEVEAAIIIPLVVLIIAGMIDLGSALYSKTCVSSAANAAAAGVLVKGGALPTESILRARWHIK